MIRILFFLSLSFLLVQPSVAEEGMWLPHLIGKYNIDEMKKQGFKLTAEDIYSANKPSIKDAIVHFGGGCTGELISPNGLIITNHHCGLGSIQRHSSVENDYITNGFWAMNQSEELPNTNLTVTSLVKMEDVTSRILQGVSPDMAENLRQAVIAANTQAIADSATKGTHYTARISSMFYGNQYILFINEVFKDVRLVGAPPKSIGNFGADTDNWMWPRHTGDFSLFRIYANKDNKPADYSPNNVPYKSKYFLPISLKGVKENDFTLVYGYPGTTQQFITSNEVNYIANTSNPLKIDLRAKRLDIMGDFMRYNDTVRIKYTSKHANVANAWKKWIGERNGLIRLGAVDKKVQLERQFNIWANQNPSGVKYRTLLQEFDELQKEMLPLQLARDLEREAFKAIEMFRFVSGFSTLVNEYSSPSIDSIKANRLAIGLMASSKSFFKDYHLQTDKNIFVAMMEMLQKQLEPELFPSLLKKQLNENQGNWKAVSHLLYKQSVFADSLVLMGILRNVNATAVSKLKNDPFFAINSQFDSLFLVNVNSPYRQKSADLDILYRRYVKGLMEMQPNRVFYPDANSTLRVTYGKVKGYSPRDAVDYLHFTTLNGIIDKSKMGVYDYVVPQKLIDLYNKKDFGRWVVNGTVPVAFIASNHTSGGNSGSPVLNAKGQLVGINFDRVWEGTMSDIMFDPAVCRNISLDIRYVLFIIDKYAGAGYLINEMKLVE
jgi:hypothetical protein